MSFKSDKYLLYFIKVYITNKKFYYMIYYIAFFEGVSFFGFKKLAKIEFLIFDQRFDENRDAPDIWNINISEKFLGVQEGLIYTEDKKLKIEILTKFGR